MAEKKKKMNNAETLRVLMAIDKKCIENGEEEIFTENFRNAINEILEQGTLPDGTQNDMLINALLQKKLKPVPGIKVK